MTAAAHTPLGRFEHGGNLFGRDDALDFSASLNPLGMPERAVAALRGNVRAFEKYPDTRCQALAGAVSALEGVAANRLCFCAGATDAFDRIADVLAPRGVVLFDPCFSGYERALRRFPAALSHVALSAADDFGFTERVLADARAALMRADAPDLVFVCTPNNPTARAADEPFLRGLLEAARAAGATVVLDECFADLAGLDSAVPLQAEFPNLIVVKAFTKTYAMAGLRLGYIVCADADLAHRLEASGAQWAVSVPAQIAGVAALEDPAYLERTHTALAVERTRLADALTGCGLRVVPSCANFILFQCAGLGAADGDLFGKLLEKGIVIRRCGNFEGLDDSWYRIAVRTAEENGRLIAALEEVLG